MSLLTKFHYYSNKYGLLHSIFSYIGRYNLGFWTYVGPSVTRFYIRKYFSENTFRVINLGGGGNCIEGVLTVDLSPRADAYVDITKQLPFENNSVDCIFCEEVIEHINQVAGLQLLEECHRVLKPSGVLRISTPDLNWFATRVLLGEEQPSINEIFYEHGHCFIYSRKSLAFQCKSAGFINLKESTYKDKDSKLGYLDSHADRFNHVPEISQYLEMQKSPV